MATTATAEARSALASVLAAVERGDLTAPTLLVVQVARALAALDAESSAGGLLSVDQAARRLAVSTDTVRRQIRAGVLRSVRVGRAVRVPAADVEAAAAPVDSV